jgi:hypothetical protein
MFKSIFNRIVVELAKNGKLLVGYILSQIPGLSDYPGLVTAINKYLADPSSQNLVDLGIQLLLAGAAGHRAFKLLVAIFGKKAFSK